MTAITIPLGTSKDEKETAETQTKSRCTVWVEAVLVSMLTVTLLVVAGFVLYVTIPNIAPSCDLPVTHPTANDMKFKAHGKLDDNDFDEDFEYDHENNVLVKTITSQGSEDNATVLHDFKRSLTTYVIPSQKKCFLGELETDSYDMLSHAKNGGILELSNSQGHRYLSHGIISPPYLERTAGPLVSNHCSGLETSWIEPSIEGASKQKRQTAAAEHGSQIVIRTPDGTVFILTGSKGEN